MSPLKIWRSKIASINPTVENQTAKFHCIKATKKKLSVTRATYIVVALRLTSAVYSPATISIIKANISKSILFSKNIL